MITRHYFDWMGNKKTKQYFLLDAQQIGYDSRFRVFVFLEILG